MRLSLVSFRVLFSVAVLSSTALLIASDVQAEEHSSFLGNLLSPLRHTLDHLSHHLFRADQTNGDSATITSGSQDGAGANLSERTYEIFRRIYNKSYSSQEEIRRRMALFMKRREEIEQSIRDYAQGRLSFSMRENPFIDWEESELKTLSGAAPPRRANELMPEERQAIVRMASLRRLRRSIESRLELNGGARGGSRKNGTDRDDSYADFNDDDDDDDDDGDDDDEEGEGEEFPYGYHGHQDSDNIDDDPGLMVQQNVPASKDWRTSNCVATPINQERCGCCYAIATMSVIETMRCLNQVSAPVLSSQHIVDCSTPRAGYQNFGCNGGWPTRVLKYLQDTGVAVRETCYPFVRRQNSCRLRQVQAQPGCTVPASPTDTKLNYRVLNNERDILQQVARVGPVVTVMKATNKFLFYANGIFDDPSCSRRRDDVDHAIVIVGYGRENGLDYWLIKNSWGTQWGQRGYAKYRRGTNACSIGHWGWVVTS